MLELGCRAARRSPVCTREAWTPGMDFPGSHELEQPRIRKFVPMGIFNADGMMFSLAGWRLVVDGGETP